MEQAREQNKRRQTVSGRPAGRGMGLLLAGSFCLVIFLLFLLAITPPSALVSQEGKAQGFVSLNTEEVFPLEEGEAKQLYPYNADHLLKVSSSLVSYLSFKGDEELSVPVNCPNPFIVTQGNFILLADEGGFNYYLLNELGLVLEGKTDAPIRAAAVSASGKMAFLMDELHTKGVLRVLSEDGKHILDWRVRDRLRSGYIISMSFTPDSEFINVSQVNTDGAHLQSIMTRLDLKKAEIALSLTQPGSGIYPQLFSRAQQDVYLINAEEVVRNQAAEVKRWLHFSRITEAVQGEQGLALLAKARPDEKTELYYFNYSDAGNLNRPETPIGTAVGSEPHALTAAYGRMAAADGDGVYIMKQNNAREANYFACGSPVIRQRFLSENHLLLICRDSVRVIRV